MENLEEYLENWIAELSRPNDFNQGPSCPYAKSTWDNSRAKIVKCPNYDLPQFWATVAKECENFNTVNDITIVATDTIFHPDDINSAVEALNIYLNVQNKDIWILVSCNDFLSMIFVQQVTKLDDASKALEKTSYYNNMHPAFFTKGVKHRRILRDNLVDKTT